MPPHRLTTRPWICISGLKGELAFETQRSREGELSPVRLVVNNRWPWPVFGVSLARGLEREPMPETGVSTVEVPGRSRVELRWNFRAPHRGVFPLEGAWIETSFPFGLTRASRRVEVQSPLLVWPATVALTTLPGSGVADATDDRGLAMRVGDQGDLLGTRGFRQGDSLRRVHWAQTARQQRMIVCERQAPERLAVRIHLDVDAETHQTQGTVCTWEQSIRILASLAESFHRMNVGTECHIGERLILLGNSPADLRRLLDLLAQLPTRSQLASGTSQGLHFRSAGRHATSRLDIRVTTPIGLHASSSHSSPSISHDSEAEGWRESRVGKQRPMRNRKELVLAVSLRAMGSGRVSDSDVNLTSVPSSGRFRLIDATPEMLSEQLPRAWRSMCHDHR